MALLARLFSLRGLLVGLRESDLGPDPLLEFGRWFTLARRGGCPWPTSFCLATVDAEGRPAARMMLLKGVDADGFVFYTHYVGRKAGELDHTPRAAMVFHWIELVRQVRVEGRVELVSAEESDAYFASRARGSRIGAWASRQSTELAGRAELEGRFRDFERQFRGRDVPRPANWGGYRVVPDRIEFWQGRPSRLHDRLCYVREGDAWRRFRLAP